MRFGIRELIMLTLVLAAPAASYFFVFMPQTERIQKARVEIEHKMEMLDNLRAETARTQDLMLANQQISDSIETIEARLPTDKEVDMIVRQVTDLAVASGLAQPALKSEQPVGAAGYREQPLTLTTEGTFAGFYNFLLSLEQLPRITRIPDFKVNTDAKTAETGILKIEFTLSIYFQQGGAS